MSAARRGARQLPTRSVHGASWAGPRADAVRALVETLQEPIIAIDPAGRVEYLNAAAATLTGWRSEIAVGRVLNDVLRLRDARHSVETRLSKNSNGQWQVPNGGPWVLCGRSGREVPVGVTVSPLDGSLGCQGGAMVMLRDSSTESGLRWQLSYQAEHDGLTELKNREVVERELAGLLAGDAGAEHALLYVDIDQFKLFNEACGYAAGDALLRRTARLLSERVRDSDVLARLGADSFAVLLKNCSMAKAVEVAEEMRERLCARAFAWNATLSRSSVSIGLVQVQACEEEAPVVLGAAEIACRMAKEQGRNRVHACDGDRRPAQREEMRWIAALLRDCEEGRFELYSQAIVPLQGAADAKPHAELLLRLTDELGAPVAPGPFIEAAERYRLTPAIDRCVVRRALADFVPKRSAGARPDAPTVSINLSGTSLSDPRFLAWLREELIDACVEPGAICFEITEMAAIGNVTAVAGFMRELKALGCRFALDDFGCGVSSFAYLKDLPVDYVKIDGRFVRDICDDEVDFAMVDAVNRVGHAMGIKTVAEHVESEDVARKLAALGLDYAQGFAFAKPGPAAPVRVPAAGQV